jgi:hypothetical protein
MGLFVIIEISDEAGKPTLRGMAFARQEHNLHHLVRADLDHRLSSACGAMVAPIGRDDK